jgi:hypothetical protein
LSYKNIISPQLYPNKQIIPSDKLTELGIKKFKSGKKEKNFMTGKVFTFSFILMAVSTGGLSTDF